MSDATLDCARAREWLRKTPAELEPDLVDRLLAHLDRCSPCAEDPLVAEAFERLAIDPSDLAAVEDVLAEQARDERGVVVAVEALLASLSGDAAALGRQLASSHGLYSLYAAQEAVSSVVKRAARRRVPREGIFLHKESAAIFFDHECAFERSALGLEIARFADLWTHEARQAPHPSPEAVRFLDWIALTWGQQRFLLRDFVALESADRFWLERVPSDARVDDPYRRWSRRQPAEEVVLLATNRAREVFLIEDGAASSLARSELELVVVAMDERSAAMLPQMAGSALMVGGSRVRRLSLSEEVHLDGPQIELIVRGTSIGGRRVVPISPEPRHQRQT